ncbi:MAG: DEAD/DEAH box helicase [Alphaproteobacteria bacterium]|nr:DEAD/DEAH box helicase [Alphaproteobacteria bacterium]
MAARADVVAWLRIVSVGDGDGFCAALLETSLEGEPIGFSVTGGGDWQEVGGPIAALFRALAHSPALAVARADELPVGMLREAPQSGVAFCLVDVSGGRVDSGISWLGKRPSPASPAGRAFAALMARREPFEPLERAAAALRMAFADVQFRQAAGIAGLNMLFSLPMDTVRFGGGMGQDLASRLRAMLAASPGPAPVDADAPLDWAGELMPFQQDGVRALLEMDRLLLADDMGLGKTVQAVAALRILVARDKAGPALVGAPASVLDQWRRELAKWAPELSAIVVRGSADDRTWQWRARKDVTLVGYETLRSDAGRIRALRPPGEVWSAVVADEAQRIKNRNDTSQAVKSLSRTRSWALTGTPVENHEDELASIMEFVDHRKDAPPARYHPGPALLKRHRELQLRRRKGDVLADLPPKLETKLTVALRPDQRRSYDIAEQEGIVYLRSLGANVTVQHILELITRLKQICNFDPKTGSSSKMDDIRDKLQEISARGNKALVFSQYANDISGVGAAVRDLEEFDPLALTGEIPVEERFSIVERFRDSDRHKAMVISLRAGGVGLNLQEASYVFHLDRWWNPAVERQAEDRAHRIGQTAKLNVIKYICTDTIEARIDRILEEKQQLFDELIDDISLDLSIRLSRRELLGLFGL